MPASKISFLNSQDMIKLRNKLSFIPIQATDIKNSLDSYKDSLDFKSEFINKHHYNTSLSPEANEKKNLVSSMAKKWQDDLTHIFKQKLRKKANSLIERAKEEGEVEASLYDSLILKNVVQKMKIDEMTRRIALETYRAKVQKFGIEKLKKQAGKEIFIEKFREKQKKSPWKKVKVYHKPVIKAHIPKLRLSNTINFDFLTQPTDRIDD